MGNQTDRLICEGQVRDVTDVLDKARAQYPDAPQLDRLAVEARALKEDLTTGDWARIGALAGLLWYKLDVVIRHLSDIATNTARIAR